VRRRPGRKHTIAWGSMRCAQHGSDAEVEWTLVGESTRCWRPVGLLSPSHGLVGRWDWAVQEAQRLKLQWADQLTPTGVSCQVEGRQSTPEYGLEGTSKCPFSVLQRKAWPPATTKSFRPAWIIHLLRCRPIPSACSVCAALRPQAHATSGLYQTDYHRRWLCD
jgi:hypothetical protein